MRRLRPSRRVAIAILAAVVAGCTAAPSAPPTSSPGAEPGSPTPCVDPLACPATPGPIQTLPPLPTPTPFPPAPAGSFVIAVGSCLRYSPGGNALSDIALHDPDLMLWLGDNIYADTEDMTVMRGIYDDLGANPRFQALAASTEMLAVWDDHDYGANNVNGTWPHKEAAKAEFLRFWQVPAGDPRHEQPGVYVARTFGEGDRTVQVILLDNRYNLDPWDYDGTDPGAQVLGEAQWAWLQERLQEPATIRLIGSGVQVVNDYDIDAEWEGWGDSPLQREHLFEVIRELEVPGVVFLSGDMHFAELTRHPDDEAALGYATWDLTASGLDQIEYVGPPSLWDNPGRVGDVLNTKRKHGLVVVDWELPDPEIHLQIWDGRNLHLDQVVALSTLQHG